MKLLMAKMVLAAVFMAFGVGCGGGGGGGGQTVSSPAGMPVIAVKIVNSAAAEFTFATEVATTTEQQATGLMNRESMEDDEAMLFVYAEERELAFWMKNTLIPLDMIFVDAQKRIVDINKNAEPLSLIPYISAAPAKYVLEVVGGLCDENGIGVGDLVVFAGY